MMIDLIFLVLILPLFLILLKRDLFSSLVSALSLLAAVLLTRPILFQIENIYSRNGFIKEGFSIVLVYVVIIVLLWGVLYAITVNIKNYEISKNRAGFIVTASLIFAISVSIGLCTSSNYLSLQLLESDKSTVCKICKADRSSLEKNSSAVILPESLEQVIELSPGSKILDENIVAQESVLKLINQARAKNKLRSLTKDSNLKRVADGYANLILNSLRFSHLDINNDSPAERVGKLGIKFTYLGENLAIAPDIESAHNALMASRYHRENILSTRFTKIGISVFNLNDGQMILIEEFTD